MEVQPTTSAKKRSAAPPLPFEQRFACSVFDAVLASGLSRAHLYAKMQSGELEYRRHGRRRLVVVASLRKLIGLDAA
jgi:hypothetical protein